MGGIQTRFATRMVGLIIISVAAPALGQQPGQSEKAQKTEDWEVSPTANTVNSDPPSSFRFLRLGLGDSPSYKDCVESLVGNYTRLRIERTDAKDDGHQMYRRSGFDRFFVGRRVSRLVVARAKLSRPALNSTVTLASVEWDSSKKGQISETSLNSNSFTTPFFRVDPDATIQIDLEVVNSSGASITLAIDAISIISDVAKPLGGANFINAENLPQLQRVATAVDTAISNFFKESVTERQGREMSLEALMLQPLKASVALPYEWTVLRRIPDLATQGDKNVGAWTIFVAKPRRSIFATQKSGEVCGAKSGPPYAQPYEDLTPTQIGQFPLTSTKTLLQHLAGSEQIGAAVTDLELAADATGSAKTSKQSNNFDLQTQARELNLMIVTEAQRLGFNVPDAYAIAQAFAYSGRFHQAARDALLRETKEKVTLLSDSATVGSETGASATSKP